MLAREAARSRRAAMRAVRARRHRGRQGQRVRPWRAPRRAGARGGGRVDARVRRHRGGRGAARGRRHASDSRLRRAQRQRPRRRLRARRSRRRSRRRRPRARSKRLRRSARHACFGCHLKIDTGMNRLGFRHDNLRAHDARGARQPAPAIRRRLHALRDGRSCPSRRFSTSSAGASIVALAALGAMGLRQRRGATPPIRRRCCATPAPGTTAVRPGLLLYGIVPPPLRGRIWTCDLPCHSPAVSWR